MSGLAAADCFWRWGEGGADSSSLGDRSVRSRSYSELSSQRRSSTREENAPPFVSPSLLLPLPFPQRAPTYSRTES